MTAVVESRSPQSPDDLVVKVDAMSAEQVSAAVSSARQAQRGWAGSATARAAALAEAADRVERAADELAALAVREVGKPLGEARGEVARTVAILRYYSQQVYAPVGSVHEPSLGGLLFTRRRPLGVAGLITPWNFPFAIPLWKAAPALAAGNAVLLKPASPATGCGLRIAELIGEALPGGVLQVVPGGSATARALLSQADALSFTGSGGVGRQIIAAGAERGVPVQAEMGGQNASIVLPDADVESAAQHIAAAAFGYAGQKCTATKRVIVVGDPQPLRDALLEAVRELPVGDPGQPGVVVGPVIDAESRDRVIDAAAAGGDVLIGGRPVDGEGWFVEPTLVENVPPDSVLACDEVFGPICTLQSAPDPASAIAAANEVRYGLVTALFTRDLDAALTYVDEIDTGLVRVNAPTSGVDFYLPFGGEKESSYGPREQGTAAMDFYTTTRTVTVAPAGGR